MEYLSLRQTAEKGDFQFEEYKHYVVQRGYRGLLKLAPTGQFQLMLKSPKTRGLKVVNM